MCSRYRGGRELPFLIGEDGCPGSSGSAKGDGGTGPASERLDAAVLTTRSLHDRTNPQAMRQRGSSMLDLPASRGLGLAGTIFYPQQHGSALRTQPAGSPWRRPRPAGPARQEQQYLLVQPQVLLAGAESLLRL